MKKNEYYTLDAILKYDADYSVIFGERSNGKTTACVAYGIKKYIESGHVEQFAIIRRWEEDLKGANIKQMFTGILIEWIKLWTHGEYNNVTCFSGQAFLSKFNEKGDKIKQDSKPFCFLFSISAEEHKKSTSYPYVTTIIFDEFLTRGLTLNDEFVKFQNLLSTIIRQRDNVKIFMLGNTVNKYSEYFNEMGLSNIRKMKKGTIDLYTYGESELRVAVEYSDFPAKKKKSDKYFAFNNPKLKMITTGSWEIDIYPHLPYKYLPKEVLFTFYINFKGEKFTCPVINHGNDVIIFIHRKTTPIIEDEYPVYSTDIKPNYNYSCNLLRPRTKVETLILALFKEKKVFYQDNDVGETIRAFINWCSE